jgi:hypothetical protein
LLALVYGSLADDGQASGVIRKCTNNTAPWHAGQARGWKGVVNVESIETEGGRASAVFAPRNRI